MNINLKITGDGMNVDKGISLIQAGKIIAFLGSETEIYNTPINSGEIIQTTTAIDMSSNNVQQSVRELIEIANPRTHAQRIVVLGFFIGKNHPKGFFTSEEVKEEYQHAREKLTPQFGREINRAINSGWIEPVRGEEKTFFVTRMGESAILEAFAQSGKSRGKTKPRTNGSKMTIVNEDSIREDVRDILPLAPTLDGFPNYHTLKTKGLKIMWLLAMAQTHEIEHLSTKELVFLASKLRDKLVIGDINGLTHTAAKKGWVTKDDNTNYLLLHTGQEYLKSLLIDENGTN